MSSTVAGVGDVAVIDEVGAEDGVGELLVPWRNRGRAASSRRAPACWVGSGKARREVEGDAEEARRAGDVAQRCTRP